MDDEEMHKEKKLQALRQALQMYRKRLGMSFEHAEGRSGAMAVYNEPKHSKFY